MPGIGTFYLRRLDRGAGGGSVPLVSMALGPASLRRWRRGRTSRASITGRDARTYSVTVVGTAHGNTLIARFNHHGDAGGTLRLRLSSDGHHITGTFKVTSGTCAGASGAFDARYLGKLK